MYEDLRIEAYGVSAKSIRHLDRIDDKARRLYFLRRSILTLLELSAALNDLDKCPEFVAIRNTLELEWRQPWDEGIAFFQKRHQFLKKIRNDIGGHFGRSAAEYAVDKLGPSAIGKIEIVAHKSGKGGGPKLHFSGELAAVATLRHIPRKGSKARAEFLIEELVLAGLTHATGCVHILVAKHLLGRFGRSG